MNNDFDCESLRNIIDAATDKLSDCDLLHAGDIVFHPAHGAVFFAGPNAAIDAELLSALRDFFVVPAETVYLPQWSKEGHTLILVSHLNDDDAEGPEGAYVPAGQDC